MFSKLKYIGSFFIFLFLLLFVGSIRVDATSTYDSNEYIGYSDIKNTQHHYVLSYNKYYEKKFGFYNKTQSSGDLKSYSTLDEAITQIDSLRYVEEYSKYRDCILEFKGEMPTNINLTKGKYYISGYVTTSTVNGTVTIADTSSKDYTGEYTYAPSVNLKSGAIGVFYEFKHPSSEILNVLSKISVDALSGTIFYDSQISLMNYYFEQYVETIYVYPSSGLSNQGKALMAYQTGIFNRDFSFGTYTIVRDSVISNTGTIDMGTGSSMALAVDGNITNTGTINVKHGLYEAYSTKTYNIKNSNALNFVNYTGIGLGEIENILTGRTPSGVVNVTYNNSSSNSLNVTISSKSKITSSDNVLIGSSPENFTINYTDAYLLDANKPAEIVKDSENNYYYKINKIVVEFINTGDKVYVDYNGSIDTIPDISREHYDIDEYIVLEVYKQTSATLVDTEAELKTLKFTNHVTVEARYVASTYNREDNVVSFVFPEGFEDTYIGEDYDYALGLGKVGLTFALPSKTKLVNMPHGYEFGGWSFDSLNGEIIEDNTFVIDDSTKVGFTVYLCYIRTYYVTFDDEELLGSNDIWVDEVVGIKEGEKLLNARPSVNPQRRGYTFVYWYTTDINEGMDDDSWNEVISEDITLKAKWNLNVYKVTYYGTTNEDGDLSSYIEEKHKTYTVESLNDGTFELPTLPDSNSTYFAGWYTRTTVEWVGGGIQYTYHDFNVQILKSYTVLQDIEIYAQFESLEEATLYYQIDNGVASINFEGVEGFEIEGNYAITTVKSDYTIHNRYALEVSEGYIIDFFFVGKDSNYEKNNEDYIRLGYLHRWNYTEILNLATEGKLYIYFVAKEVPFTDPVFNQIDTVMEWDIDNGIDARATMSALISKDSKTYIFNAGHSGILEPTRMFANRDGTVTITEFFVKLWAETTGTGSLSILIVSNDEMDFNHYTKYTYEDLLKYTYHKEFTATITVVDRVIEKPELAETTFYYDGEEKEVTLDENISEYLMVDESRSTLSASEVGEYYIYYKLTNPNYTKWVDGLTLESDGSYKISWIIEKKIVDMPNIQNTTLYYSNRDISPTPNYDSDYVNITTNSTESAANVGTYYISFELKDPEHTEWSNPSLADSFGVVTKEWTIQPRTLRMPTNVYGELIYNHATQSFEVDVVNFHTENRRLENWNADYTWFAFLNEENYVDGKFIIKGKEVGTYTLDVSLATNNLKWNTTDTIITLEITPYLLDFKGKSNLDVSLPYTGSRQELRYYLKEIITNAPTWVEEITDDWKDEPFFDLGMQGGNIFDGTVQQPTPAMYKVSGIAIGTYTMNINTAWLNPNVDWSEKVPVENITLTIEENVFSGGDGDKTYFYNGQSIRATFNIKDYITGPGKEDITFDSNTFEGCNYSEEDGRWYVEGTTIGTYSCTATWKDSSKKWSGGKAPTFTLNIIKAEYEFDEYQTTFEYINLNDMHYEFTVEDLRNSICKTSSIVPIYPECGLTNAELEMFVITQREERLVYGLHEGLVELTLKPGYEDVASLGETVQKDIYIQPSYIDLEQYWVYEEDNYKRFTYSGTPHNIFSSMSIGTTIFDRFGDLVIEATKSATEAGNHKMQLRIPCENYILYHWELGAIGYDETVDFPEDYWEYDPVEKILSFIWTIDPLIITDVSIGTFDQDMNPDYYIAYENSYEQIDGYKDVFTYSLSENGEFTTEFPYSEINPDQKYTVYFKHHRYNLDGSETQNFVNSDQVFVWRQGYDEEPEHPGDNNDSSNQGGGNNSGGSTSGSTSGKTGGCSRAETPVGNGLGELIMLCTVLGAIFIKKKYFM